jgi:hypothetical protein
MRNGLLKSELQRLEDACRTAESELACAKGSLVRNAQALADSLERNRVLEEELCKLRGAARSVITEVLGPLPRSSTLVADLSQIPGEVAGLITDVVFHGASGVLTLVASQYPSLYFGAVERGYAAGWSADQPCKLG